MSYEQIDQRQTCPTYIYFFSLYLVCFVPFCFEISLQVTGGLEGKSRQRNVCCFGKMYFSELYDVTGRVFQVYAQDGGGTTLLG